MRDLGATARRSGERDMKWDDDFGYCDDTAHDVLVAVTEVVDMRLEMLLQRLKFHIKMAARGSMEIVLNSIYVGHQHGTFRAE